MSNHISIQIKFALAWRLVNHLRKAASRKKTNVTATLITRILFLRVLSGVGLENYCQEYVAFVVDQPSAPDEDYIWHTHVPTDTSNRTCC